MKNTIRRMFTLSVMTAALAAGIAANADPLPPPVVLHPLLEKPVLLSPPHGVAITYHNSFTWSDVKANKYTLKIKNLDSGAKVKATMLGADCEVTDVCDLDALSTGLFNHVDDGDTIEWRVIAKFGSKKTKSAKRQLVMNTVSAPTTVNPDDFQNLNPGGVLRWHDATENAEYKIVVKDASTGQVALKTTILSEDCDEYCEIEPFDGVPFPADDTWFTWRVKAKGQNGDKQKSDPFSFKADSIAAAD